MFGQMEWLFWFVIVGGLITIIYIIITHFIEKKYKKNRESRTVSFTLPFLNDNQFMKIEEGFNNSEPKIISKSDKK